VTGGTRYGDLLHEAAASIASADVLLARQRFAAREDAARAVEAYRDLLHAVYRHGWALLGGDDRVAGSRSVVRADPRETTAALLFDAVGRVAARALLPEEPRPPGGPVGDAWAVAAGRIRLATDLLATHRSPDGAARSPMAALLDEPAVRAAGLGGLARLTDTVSGAADPLALRAGQAGMPWSQVRQLIPRAGHLGALSGRLHRLCSPNPPDAATRLGNLELARPPIRTDTATHELADRLARMHRGAWELARTPDVGVASLLDYAALGIMLHGHTAAALAAHLPAAPGGVRDSAARALRQVKRGGGTWQAIHLRLRELRTATPGSLALRGDLQRVRDVLRGLVPLDPGPGPDNVGAPDRTVLTTLVGGLRSLGDIARWNEHVLDDLATRGQLYLSAAALTGNEVADRDDLIEAKLTHRVARVPPERIGPLRDCYQAVRAANAAAPSTTGHSLAEARPARPQRPHLER